MPQPTWAAVLATTLNKEQAAFFTPEFRAVLETTHPSTRQPQSLAVVRELARYSTTVLVPERIKAIFTQDWKKKDLEQLTGNIELWASQNEPTNEATVGLVRSLQHNAQFRKSTDATACMLWPAARLLGYGYPCNTRDLQDSAAVPRPTTMPKAVADFLTVCHCATLRDWVVGQRAIREVTDAIRKLDH